MLLLLLVQHLKCSTLCNIVFPFLRSQLCYDIDKVKFLCVFFSKKKIYYFFALENGENKAEKLWHKAFVVARRKTIDHKDNKSVILISL